MRFVLAGLVLLTLCASALAGPEKRTDKRLDKQVSTRGNVSSKAVGATAAARTEQKKRRDRSIGAPWSGRLQSPARFEGGERLHVRRPWRTYATKTTVSFIRRAIRDVYEVHPKAHVLAIGDFSAETGGRITHHASHQSGRDVDIGLFYKKPPKGYPQDFVSATPETIAPGPMWTLLSSLARTADEDGGVQVIFLDRKLGDAIYQWAVKRGVSQQRLERVFRLLRHIPKHDDHLHVRFKCRAADRDCR
jgi:hypothetical protein